MRAKARRFFSGTMAVFLLAGGLVGCSSTEPEAAWHGRVTPATWQKRIGTYTYKDAVRDYGHPDGEETRADGTILARWVIKAEAFQTDITPRWDPDFGPHGIVRKGNPNSMAGVMPPEVLQLQFGVDRRLIAANPQFR